jgi:hypothetical protein
MKALLRGGAPGPAGQEGCCGEQQVNRIADTLREAQLTEGLASIEPKVAERIRLARNTLHVRTARIQEDMAQFWSRSRAAYRLSRFFFLLACIGPAAGFGLAIWFMEWHYLFANLSLAFIPFSIGVALLKHDNNLREQHQAAAQEIVTLNRLQLALDYAQLDSNETYRQTLLKIIDYLLTRIETKPVPSQNPPPAQKAPPEPDKEHEHSLFLIGKALEALVAYAPKPK